MVDLSLQKRLASEILGVGVSRVRVDPARVEDVADAITREEIKRLIKDGAVYAEPAHGNTGYSSKVRREQRRKGRRRGHGKRKGVRAARTDEKEVWMGKIRKIRRYLRFLRDNKIIDRKTYRRLYRLAKGGFFKSFNSLRTYLIEHGYLKQ